MSDAPQTTFHRVISDQQLFGKQLVTSTIAGVLASVILGGVVLCAGGFAELLTKDADPMDTGLLPATRSDYSGAIVGRIVSSIPSLHHRNSALTTLFVLIVILLCLRSVLRAYAQRRINAHVSQGVARLRERIHRHALRSNPGDLTGDQRRTAASLFQDTAQRLQDCAQRWAFLRLTVVCDLVVLVIGLLCVQGRVGLECVIPIVVCWSVSRIETARHLASANLLKEQVDRGLQKLTEDMDKARIVAGYGMETLEHDHFSENLARYQSRYNRLRQQQLYRRWTSLLILIATIAFPAFVLARHVLFGQLIGLPGGVMIAVIVGLAILCLNRLEAVPALGGAATVAADDINQYLLRIPSVSQVVGARFLEPLSRSLQFNQVSFETEKNPDLLSNLDLKINAGQRVALLALNSEEAEALIGLIPRFSDPSRGQVLVDGQDIKRVTLESLRAEAVIVGGQEPVFNATVLENVTAGQPDISRQDAIEACKMAHAESFIRQLPKGNETHLGDGAVQLDVGQTFRLSLARAIARKPALLVIQEPDSPLDAETKAVLDDTYQRICSGRTVIFLPHRLSTVKKCDRVVMLHNGRVASDGTHDELVRSSELYRHWEYMRFNVFRSEG